MGEAYPLMLSTVRELGCLPNINDKLSWLPLDIAAKAVCEIALEDGEGSVDRAMGKSCEVYHVVNNDTSASFGNLLERVNEIREEPFEVVEPKIWLEKFEKLDKHPAKALIGLWRRAYEGDSTGNSNLPTAFETKNAEEVS
jgi:hypothetical protein